MTLNALPLMIVVKYDLGQGYNIYVLYNHVNVCNNNAWIYHVNDVPKISQPGLVTMEYI